MFTFKLMVFIAVLVVMVSQSKALPVINNSQNESTNDESPVLMPKGREAYLIAKAYTAISEAGKALETLIQMHGKKCSTKKLYFFHLLLQIYF